MVIQCTNLISLSILPDQRRVNHKSGKSAITSSREAKNGILISLTIVYGGYEPIFIQPAITFFREAKYGILISLRIVYVFANVFVFVFANKL